MKIDMHAHWQPPALADAMRRRRKLPRIVRNAQGIEVIRHRLGEEPVDRVFDDEHRRIAEMDRQGITTAVLSMLGNFSWIERLPLRESLPLVRLYNDSISALCRRHPGRFAAYASVPQTNMKAAARELDRAMRLPGMVGVQMPCNWFLDRRSADRVRPVFEAANRHRAAVLVHYGPRPGDVFPTIPPEVDNARRRNGTLDMQAGLSAAMVTLCLTDFLEPYPEVRVQLHNLGGNIPYEVERMDHRCLLDTPHEELPSKRFARARVMLDCNSFGPRAIEAGVRLYGADRIVFGTDGTEFGCEWSTRAVREADIGPAARRRILHRNAEAMIGHLVRLPGGATRGKPAARRQPARR